MKQATPHNRLTGLILSSVMILTSVFAGFPGIVHAEEAEQYLSPYQTLITDSDGNRLIKAIAPLPPPEIKMAVANEPAVQSEGILKTLSNVPAFYWSYGCSATSAAMLFGYYDRIGYSNIYTGSTNGGIMPLDNSTWGTTAYSSVTCGECPICATHDGIDGRSGRGHVDDYWIDYDNMGPDPYQTNGWTEHSSDCTADFMGTNQAKYNNPDGATSFYYYMSGDPLYDYDPSGDRDGCHGLRLFAQSRGYTVLANYNQVIYEEATESGKGFTYANFQSEIDAGRPVLIHVVGHTMLGYGYDTSSNTIYIHDTWDYSNHSMTWDGTYDGMQHYGVTVFQMNPVAPTVTNSTGPSNITSTEARLNGSLTTGGASTTVTVYWGPNDGGTTPGNWLNSEPLGVLETGTFFRDISGLTPDQTYYYRCYALNSVTGVWSSATTSFDANPAPTMEQIAEPEGVLC